MRKWLAITGAALACLAAGPAQAQAPDLKGTWVERPGGGVVMRGQFEHQPARGNEIVFGGPLSWTLTIERQEGLAFSGQWASQNRTDPMVGAISLNGRSLHLADDNGALHGELRGPDEMEVCRSIGGESRMLAMCRLFARRR